MELLKSKSQLDDEELQKRIVELPINLQAEFLQATDLLLQRESEICLKKIQESRDEINNLMQKIRNEQTALKLEFGNNEISEEGLSDSIKVANNKLMEFVEKRERNKKISNISYMAEKEKEAVENYLKAVGRHQVENMNTQPDYLIPKNNFPGQIKFEPGTAYKIRMEDPQPVNYSKSVENEIHKSLTSINENYNKEQEELINKLREQDSQIITERERQIKLIEKKKATRQVKKVDEAKIIAASLISQSQGADEKQQQNKFQQEKAIQERLAKARENRNVNPLDERSSTLIMSSEKVHEENSLFNESINKLTVRPQTSDNKSPKKSTDNMKLKTPVKSGWADSAESKDSLALFEVANQYPQFEGNDKKQKSKANKKNKESIEKQNENNSYEFITIED